MKNERRKKISKKIKQLWQNKIYREKVTATHRKPVSKRGNYLQVFSPNHPRANERGYIYQHIIIMEKIIGRFLEPKEIVHHIDGNRYNNHPDNLRLFQNCAFHMNFHRKNKIKSFAKLV